MSHSGVGSCSKLGGGGYLSYRDGFIWRKITFLWSVSKTGGLQPPFSASYDKQVLCYGFEDKLIKDIGIQI